MRIIAGMVSDPVVTVLAIEDPDIDPSRAEENTAIAGQMGRELQLLEQEMQRRKH